MPQQRTLLHHADGLTVERVRRHGVHAVWSPTYEAPTPRLVLPASGAAEFSFGCACLLVDALTVLGLPGQVPYQMKDIEPRERTHIVVSAAQAPAPWQARPAAWRVTPRSLWQLRCHWRALAQGRERAGSTPALLAVQLRDASVLAGEGGRGHAAVQRARQFMAGQASGGWRVQDVAEAACCSAFHLARLFRRHTGMSLLGYRQHLRMAHALQRLEDGERDLAGLAHDLGYSSQSHLGEVFRREIGATPAQARRALAV